MSVVAMDGLPPGGAPEFAFAGRSNVGKSSLLNAVTGRKHLARTSADPGRTRQLNFFRVGDAAMLVDLPGYGYARAPKTEIAQWTQLTGDYLKGRQALARVFLLIDSRHGLKPSDVEVMKTLDTAAVSYQIVLTKADKLRAGELEAVQARTLAAIAKRPAAHPVVHATSSSKGDGIEALRAEIATLAQALNV
jgi:GTP-binding protein